MSDEKIDVLALLDHGIACSEGVTRTSFNRTRAKQMRDAVAELIEAASRANGDHHAPDDCYATGPLTGNPIADLVACPGCALAAALARVRSG